MSNLNNLNELVLRCRRDASREYIREAISCYESGAIRSAIVATWIAVFFDIMDKLQELSIGGDAAAESLVEAFAAASENNNIQGLLNFERSILREAYKKVQMIGEVEYALLSRIQEDRNKCAHPSLSSSGDVFSPEPELARVHIVNAVIQLMQYPPATGKAAINEVIRTIDSRLFPVQVNKATAVLRKTGLGHPRKALLRNVIVLLLKKSFAKNSGGAYKYHVALKAIMQMHRAESISFFKSEFSDYCRRVDDSDLTLVISLIHSISEISVWLDDDVRDRLRSSISYDSGDDLSSIEYALEINEFRDVASRRIQSLTFEKIKDWLFFSIPKEFRARVIEILKGSENFDKSNEICNFIQQNLGDFDREDYVKLSEVGFENEQVAYSFSFKRLMSAIKDLED